MLQNRRHHPLPPLGVVPRWELVSASFPNDASLSCLELGTVPKHGVHDDGKTPGQGDAGLPHG